MINTHSFATTYAKVIFMAFGIVAIVECFISHSGAPSLFVHGLNYRILLNIIFTIILLTLEAAADYVFVSFLVCAHQTYSIKEPTRRIYKSIYVSPVNSATNLKLCCLPCDTRNCESTTNFQTTRAKEKKIPHRTKKKKRTKMKTIKCDLLLCLAIAYCHQITYGNMCECKMARRNWNCENEKKWVAVALHSNDTNAKWIWWRKRNIRIRRVHDIDWKQKKKKKKLITIWTKNNKINLKSF